MNKYVFVAAALGIIGITMIIAGIFNLRAAPEAEEEISQKRSNKKSQKQSNSNIISQWMFGGSSSMDLKKQGSLRIKAGIVFIIIGLVVAAVYLL